MQYDLLIIASGSAKVKIVYAPFPDGPFTKPIASRTLQHVCNEKDIEIAAGFARCHGDNEKKQIMSYDGHSNCLIELAPYLPPFW